MQTILVHDIRLSGNTPQGSNITAIRVGPSVSLDRMVNDIRSASTRHGTDVRLAMLCHGYSGANGELGYGLQLCQEDLTLTTVNRLRPLSGLISYGIDIYSCGASNTATWHVGVHGDGWLLCSRIAQATQSIVRAAVLTQYYNYYNGFLGLFQQSINFGRWEGEVITFNPRGSQIASEISPHQ